jgi:stage V sporulation protein D (sporulation-specific penicillin-binding protein)
MKRGQLVFRIRLLSAVLLLVAIILIGRLYEIQIIKADHYLARGESQYVYTQTNLYSRGSILFSTRDNTAVSAATIKSGYILAVNPTQLVDSPQLLCESAAEFIEITLERCVERVSLPGRTYLELATRLNDNQAEAVKKLGLKGVTIYKNQWRYYPGHTLAARTIGFVGFAGDGDELRGKYGLERYYDSTLYEKRQEKRINFFAELFSNLGELVYRKDEAQGGNVVTSLEPSVSRMLDAALLDIQEQYSSKLSGAIIMDPYTGEIIAMNVVPGFDLNTRTDASVEEFKNPLVEDLYEFGSTVKALTVAAGLDSGAITAQSLYNDTGSVTLNTFTIRNFDGRARGEVDMQEVLNQSLNTGVSHIVTRMGKDSFRDYFLNFKLGSETGIDLPSETFGLVGNLRSPRDVEYATASFGQGIATTPVAMTRALAVLANGGTLVTPHLGRRIEYKNGFTKEIRYPEGERVLSEETSEEISRMLSVVVDDALRGGTVALPHHTIAAKTGTAQIADPVNGGYYEDRYLHSFFGYFPAFEPKFIVFMYTVEPKGVRYASETLTDPFMKITNFLINYYSIPPDR